MIRSGWRCIVTVEGKSHKTTAHIPSGGLWYNDMLYILAHPPALTMIIITLAQEDHICIFYLFYYTHSHTPLCTAMLLPFICPTSLLDTVLRGAREKDGIRTRYELIMNNSLRVLRIRMIVSTTSNSLFNRVRTL